MSYYTRTRTHTLSYTYIDVTKVNWKVRSDLRYLRVLYGFFDEQYEAEMSGDLYQWVLAGYASQIKFLFYTRSGLELRFGLRYRISTLGVVTRDDDAGNIPYVSFPFDITFNVLVVPSERWRGLTQTQKDRFYERLSKGWGPTNLNISERGSWTVDSIYSSNSLSAQRDIFSAL